MPSIYLSPPDISARDHASVDAVLTSNWVAPVGPALDAFEAAVATRAQRKYAVALNSGTAALHLALQILGINSGDAVVCPTLTFAASANPICYLGAEPIFIDSERRTWNMDPELLEEALKTHDNIKAVIVVHLYGQCAEMDHILELCARYEVPVIEDAAEALGASYRGRPAGSMGTFSFFSFNGNKIITTSGGGMLLANERDQIERARYLATQAREPVAHYEHKAIGYNYRMSNLLAGLGNSQLTDLDRRITTRKAHFDAYQRALGNIPGIDFMPIAETNAANYWLTCLTVDPVISGSSRDSILAALAQADIEARPLWKPLHLQPIFQNAKCFGGALATQLFDRGLCLPSGSNMSDDQRQLVIDTIRYEWL
ncbi:aminotransferase class I/II-fold pyridoxal phosphate-dependent enzyme [Coraliomargarita algicola]|uniref:Aminotransferase class I/II-fold pyridoxal phosphate-dependent enzyme n=1 Tax=Coraliomargarita algicola TaxID=3092156 RepID=A0ABZ0RII0_9BACT|nr:aminotransferase class I/II-fold pyridoxal phosphate-dependent enzyme [Coraliomargarita sp. J2-16]WPJ96011.1 aminotransferase class I/II-fold pyridoxal phosphate-dependent enzyme [Coraliomargarita sp. J2-16]